ncbi:MAG: hypothetical protein JW741_12325, partial [Sedimentisphaerales bacterium]|nr:hypothetical protein [Sedimentisphaerales bacterium]
VSGYKPHLQGNHTNDFLEEYKPNLHFAKHLYFTQKTPSKSSQKHKTPFSHRMPGARGSGNCRIHCTQKPIRGSILAAEAGSGYSDVGSMLPLRRKTLGWDRLAHCPRSGFLGPVVNREGTLWED